jgi:lipopolysaccharide assembly outer membrane protein LptD (OstA)
MISSVAPSGILTVVGAAQSPDSAGTAAVYEVTADSSSLKEIDNEMVLELWYGVKIIHDDITATSRRGTNYFERGLTLLVGDVEINQGTITMWGDEGEYHQPNDRATLRNNVRVVDVDWEVTCDEATYSRTSGHAWLIGNVVAHDSASTLHADSLFYDREAAMVEVFGNVRITNPDEGFAAEGDHGYYFRDSGEGIIDRNPHLIIDPESPEPATIDSDTMRVFPDRKHAIAYYTVKILKGNTVTQCDSAVIYDEENRLELYGNPLAKQDLVSMKGAMMALSYDDEEVDRIDINGIAEIHEAQLDTLVLGRNNWIRGDTISLHIHENRVDSIYVLQNATSTYYPRTPNKTESNFVRGDTMFFRFDSDSLSYVRITGSADGEYQYIDLRQGQTTDSLRAVYDTNLTYIPFPEKAEKVVYSARRIEYFATARDLRLKKNAEITYQDRKLYGDEISYLSSLQLLDARGDPKLEDAGQEFFGLRMNYDLDAGAGLVTDGSTRFEQGFYRGENVAKVGDNEMKVWNSKYTTCDLMVPHYHVKAKHMKLYTKDKAVSGSMVLYIGETPLFYLPFIANSIRRGRRSGFLRPDFEFGITKQTGRYIRNVGYYWATNDYTDFTFVFDFNEDRSMRVYTRNQYKVRYKFDGRVGADFYRDLDQYLNEWRVDATHQHNLGEKFKLTSDLHFVSSDQAPQAISRIDNVERVVDRSLRSNISISKNWDVVGMSLAANRTQNLNIEDPFAVRVSTVFPNVRLSIPQRDLFFGERHSESEQGFGERLLRGIKYSPGLSGQRSTEDREYRFTEAITSRQSLGFQSPQKIAFVNVSPTLSASNTYTRTVEEIEEHTIISGDPPDTTLVLASREVEDDNEFVWSFGANSSTNIYGTFYPKIGRLRGVRHVISPTVSYNFNPKIGSRPRSQRFGVRLANSFDLKMKQKEHGKSLPGNGASGSDASDESEEERLQKISGFLIWTLSSSYDPEASKDEGWSNVSSAVNLRVFGTSISMNQSIDPYEQEILSTSIQTRFSLKGTHPFGRSDVVKVEELNVVAAADTTRQTDTEPLRDRYGDVIPQGEGTGPVSELALEEGRLPWSAGIGLSYNKTLNADPRATMDMTAQFDLTTNWRITYWTSYDIQNRERMGQNFGVHRDLHCWEMSLSRQQLGDEWQFYFRINLKAHPELFGETGQRGLGGFAGGIPGGSMFR